jgi:hypothetical protein
MGMAIRPASHYSKAHQHKNSWNQSHAKSDGQKGCVGLLNEIQSPITVGGGDVSRER